MLKQPIYYEFNLDARTSPSKLIAISHVDDKYSEVLEVAVKQNDRFVYMGGATVVARMVLHREKDYLLSDSVPCTVNANGNILIPFDNAVVKTSQGVVKIEFEHAWERSSQKAISADLAEAVSLYFDEVFGENGNPKDFLDLFLCETFIDRPREGEE